MVLVEVKAYFSGNHLPGVGKGWVSWEVAKIDWDLLSWRPETNHPVTKWSTHWPLTQYDTKMTQLPKLGLFCWCFLFSDLGSKCGNAYWWKFVVNLRLNIPANTSFTIYSDISKICIQHTLNFNVKHGWRQKYSKLCLQDPAESSIYIIRGSTTIQNMEQCSGCDQYETQIASRYSAIQYKIVQNAF